MKIDKVEKEWNAEKYEEKQRIYALNNKVGTKTKEEPAEHSQGSEGEETAYVAQQPNSQGKTKLMDSRDGEHPTNQKNHASIKSCDPVSPGPKLEPDTA